jgi:hypothetical protein
MLIVLLVCSTILAIGVISGASASAMFKEGAPRPNLVSAAASLLGPEHEICCSWMDQDDQRYPAVAYAYNRVPKEHMVVFHSERLGGQDIYAMRNLHMVSLGHVISTGSNCTHPDVVYNGLNDEYLVVWQQYNNAQSKWEIYGIIESETPSTPFQIAEWSNANLKYPVVAWNSYRNEYMVAWQTEDSTGSLLGIGRRKVTADGSTPSTATFITQSGAPGNPDIAYNLATDQYLVVWAQVGENHIDIWGGRLNHQGTLQGSVFPISQADDEQQLPAITTNEQNRYLVVWQDLRWGDWDIYGQLLDGNGNAVGGELWITPSYDEDTRPDVAAYAPAQQYLVSWQQSNVSGEKIVAELLDANGSPLKFVEIALGNLGDNAHPAVALYPPGYYVVYEWGSWAPETNSDIYARKWTPQAIFLPLILRGP